MRCGKETEGKAVFCPECLEDMARHPVKPGTTVHIPVRHDEEIRRPVKKKPELTPEEQLRQAQSLIRTLFFIVAGLSVALMITGALLFHALTRNAAPANPTEPPVSHHYTVIASAEDE